MADNLDRDSSEENVTFVDKRSGSTGNGATPTASAADSGVPESEPALDDEIDDAQSGGAEQPAAPQSTFGLVGYVAGMFASEAWTQLGLIANPATGKAEMNLVNARAAIDAATALVAIADSSASDLPEEARRDLKRVLGDLRLNFLDRSRQS